MPKFNISRYLETTIEADDIFDARLVARELEVSEFDCDSLDVEPVSE